MTSTNSHLLKCTINCFIHLTALLNQMAVYFSAQMFYALATDLNLHILHQHVTSPVKPAEGSVCRDANTGKFDAKIRSVDEITVAGHSASADYLISYPNKPDCILRV